MFAGGAWTEARPPRVSKIGPALSSSNTIRRRPSADPVQKHAPGNGYGAKKGLTSRGPLQKQTFLASPTNGRWGDADVVKKILSWVATGPSRYLEPNFACAPAPAAFFLPAGCRFMGEIDPMLT